MAPFSAHATGEGNCFQEDVDFLNKHTEVIVLSDRSGQARVAVAPAYQGRIMTTTAGGAMGHSTGWINRQLIASGKTQPHINVYGGEDRFWIGPEGGQFSVFFAKGARFDLANWFTPAAIDTEPFETVERDASSARFRREMTLTNYSGTRFELEVNRLVRVMERSAIEANLGLVVPENLQVVGVESVNTLRNTGQQAWTKESGLLSIWILGMFNASASTTIVIPFAKGTEAERGAVVNDAYFGKVPANRLAVNEQRGVVFFSGDGKFRSKIGISPKRSASVLGSYDAKHAVLTIVQFLQPKDATDYVNSMWELQKNPFGGDAINSYNDNGNLGAFYELETSSPALALNPGQSASHTHRTCHLQGDLQALDAVSRSVFGVSLEEIKSALPAEGTGSAKQ